MDSKERGTGYCYSLHIAPNKRLDWTLTTRRNVNSRDELVPCIQYNKKFHCRYGNT